jgi:tetratricopeptide (TPR) repeat protein
LRSTSNELFNLIKSLSKSEKGYFKKFSALHTIGKENKYLKLFDLIDKQTVYDENKVKHAFEGDSFAKHLHVAKGYLYKIILKSLNQFYYNNTVTLSINNLINSAMILFMKGLLDESWKALLKARVLAHKNEKHESLLQILKLEKKIMLELNAREYSDKAMEFTDEKKKINKKISDIITFEEESNKIRLLYQSRSMIRRKEESDEYDKIVNTPLDEKNPQEFESKIYLCHKFINYYMAVSDDQKAYDYAKKLVLIIESNPEYIKEFTNEYVSALNMCLVIMLFTMNYDESKKFIQKLNSLKPLSSKLQSRIRLIISNFLLTKYIRTGEFEMGLKIIPEIENQLNLLSYEDRKFNEEKIDYSLSYIYFGLGDYGKALEYINKILNDKDKSTKIDLLSFAHILNSIIHYELDNMELLPYIIKNTYRFLLRRKKLYKVEREVLNFIRNIPDLITKEQQIDAFQEIKENIIKITKDPYERIALDYFDFISWLESKIEGKKFSEIVKAANS